MEFAQDPTYARVMPDGKERIVIKVNSGRRFSTKVPIPKCGILLSGCDFRLYETEAVVAV